jgi:hypothetical protein
MPKFNITLQLVLFQQAKFLSQEVGLLIVAIYIRPDSRTGFKRKNQWLLLENNTLASI